MEETGEEADVMSCRGRTDDEEMSTNAVGTQKCKLWLKVSFTRS